MASYASWCSGGRGGSTGSVLAASAPGFTGLAGFDAAGHAVLGGELEQLVEHLADHVVGLLAREERHGLARNQRDDRGDRLRLERLHELRAAVGVGGSEHETAPACTHESLERTEQRLRRLTPCRPERHDDGNGARQLERVPEGGVVGLEDDLVARHRRGVGAVLGLGALLLALDERRQVDGTAQGCARRRDRVRHGISDAPMRLSDQPRSRICWLSSPAPTPGT